MFEKDVERLQRRIQNNEGKEIVFYGSSSIRLWVSMEEDLAPFSTLRLGFGGSTFEWLNYYFESIFKDIEPRHVIIYAGDNDMSNGFSPEQIRDQFNELQDKLNDLYSSIDIHGITIKPSPHRKGYLEQIIETNHLLKEALTSEGKSRQINIFDPMLKNGEPRPELFKSDGLHMNRKGYEIWSQEVFAYLQKKMGQKPH